MSHIVRVTIQGEKSEFVHKKGRRQMSYTPYELQAQRFSPIEAYTTVKQLDDKPYRVATKEAINDL